MKTLAGTRLDVADRRVSPLQRPFELDWLRVIVVLLVLVYHVGNVFDPDPLAARRECRRAAILLTYFVDRAFLVLAGPVWTVAVWGAAALLAVFFSGLKQHPTAH